MENLKINWTQCGRYMKERLLLIIGISLLCAVLAVCLAMSRAGTARDGGVGLQAVMNMNHDSYYSLNDKPVYSDGKELAGTYNSYASIYLDLKDSEMGDMAVDYAQLSKTLENDFKSLARSGTSMEYIINKLDLHSYDDMKTISPYELSWLVNCNFQGNHIVKIVVTDVNPERAQKIAIEVMGQFIEKVKKYFAVDNLYILDEASLPQEKAVAAVSLSKKEMIQYSAAGFLVGLIMSSGVLLILFLVKPVLRTESDVRDLGYDFFAVVKKDTKELTIRQTACRLAAHEDLSDILLAGADDKKEAAKQELVKDLFCTMRDQFKELGQDMKVNWLADALRDPDFLLRLKDHNGLLLVCRYGKTPLKDLAEVRRMIEEMDLKLTGVLMYD